VADIQHVKCSTESIGGELVKFIHAADIHLDSALHGLERYEGAPVAEIRSATRRAFDNLIELAIDEQVAFVLLVGDLYDGDWKDYNTGLYFVERMGRLRDASIRVFIVAGNHDAASQITKHLRLPDNVTLFSTRKPERVVLDDLGVSLCGQGFATRAVTDDISQGYPQGDPQLLNIGLLHTCLDGKPGHEPYAPCTIDGLRSKGYQYWALGHVHKREEISQDPWIVFPGNIQGRHIREIGPKGCTLVTVDGGEIAEVVHRDLDVMRWSICELDVSAAETVDDIYEQVQEELQSSLDAADGRPVAVRLVLYGACCAHVKLHADRERWIQEYRALATGLGGAGIWLEKISIKTKPGLSRDEVLDREDALSGLLRAIQNMELDSSVLDDLAEEMSVLRQKLPAELLAGDDPFDPANPEFLKETLEDIKELLANRLLSTENKS
jgi:DNA repair exonuclease SbcCD nuclease subunit